MLIIFFVVVFSLCLCVNMQYNKGEVGKQHEPGKGPPPIKKKGLKWVHHFIVDFTILLFAKFSRKRF